MRPSRLPAFAFVYLTRYANIPTYYIASTMLGLFQFFGHPKTIPVINEKEFADTAALIREGFHFQMAFPFKRGNEFL
jgi:hypothetical protein